LRDGHPAILRFRAFNLLLFSLNLVVHTISTTAARVQHTNLPHLNYHVFGHVRRDRIDGSWIRHPG